MIANYEKPSSPHLVWVFAGPLVGKLDSATWLETTRELRKLGWCVTLINVGLSGWRPIQGVETFCISQPNVYFLGKFVFHVKLLFRLLNWWSNTDILLFHHNSALWLLPLRFVRWLIGQQQPVFIMDTRDFVDYFPGNPKHWMRRLYKRLAYWLAANLADGQTTITPRMAQFANIPSRQLLGIWPSGVNPESFSHARIERHWPATNEPIKLFYVGMFAKKRNLLSLCRAVDRASVKDMLFSLTLVGDGEERSNLESLAQNSSDKIHILPPVPHDQIPNLLAAAHIGVTSLPKPNQAKYEASSPIKLFEYMAAGLPILSTSSVCHTEVVGNGSYAFWADSADEIGLLAALREIWHCRANLAQMGAESEAAADSWTWAASARKLNDALRKGLTGRGIEHDCLLVK